MFKGLLQRLIGARQSPPAGAAEAAEELVCRLALETGCCVIGNVSNDGTISADVLDAMGNVTRRVELTATPKAEG